MQLKQKGSRDWVARSLGSAALITALISYILFFVSNHAAVKLSQLSLCNRPQTTQQDSKSSLRTTQEFQENRSEQAKAQFISHSTALTDDDQTTRPLRTVTLLVSPRNTTWQFGVTEVLADDGSILAQLELLIPLEKWADSDIVAVEVDQPIGGMHRAWCSVDGFTQKTGELSIPIAKQLVMENEPFPTDLIEHVNREEFPTAVKILLVPHNG